MQFIEIEEADAIVKRIPALESVEIEQGAFGGRPPRPAGELQHARLFDPAGGEHRDRHRQIAELMRQLYLIRQNLSAAIPGAGLMETPDVEEATSFLIHPGVRAYVNGEQRSWFDKYSDYIYLGLFLGSGFGSVAAGMFGWMRSGNAAARPPLPGSASRRCSTRCAMPGHAERARCGRARGGRDFPFGVRAGRRWASCPATRIASFDMAMSDLRSRIAARRAALRTG